MKERGISTESDILVIGGTPAGCAAAIAAARHGSRVVLLEQTPVLGGLNSNGIGMGDFVHRSTVGGIYGQFLDGIDRRYRGEQPIDELYADGSTSNVYFEPHVSAHVWRNLVDKEPGVQVHTGAVTVDVDVIGRRIVGVQWRPARTAFGDPDMAAEAHTANAAIVIDATYEGDIAAWSGVSYRIGREPRSASEPHAGVIYTNYVSRQPWGGFASDSILPGSTGEADDRIMAFNYRLVVKRYPSARGPHRIARPPAGYAPKRYRWTEAMRERAFGSGGVRGPHGKMYLNVPHLGNDLVGPNREYIIAHPSERERLRQVFIDHALGYLYFIQTEGGSPELGLADDEFADNHGLPYQIYVREGRRIRGVAEITEADVTRYLSGDLYRPARKHDAVAVGDFEIDVKPCRDESDAETEYGEGALFLRTTRSPFQIPYGCMVPKEVENLLVPVAISATHVAYSAVRLEATWAALGQAAGIAASTVATSGSAARAIDIDRLQDELVADRCVLVGFTDVSCDRDDFLPIQRVALRGYVPADARWRFRPDEHATWRDLVEMIVAAWEVPLSVTGSHFAAIDGDDAAFPLFESVYDLCSRAGIHPFAASFKTAADPHLEFHRPCASGREYDVDLGAVPARSDAVSLVAACAHALGNGWKASSIAGSGRLSRGEVASLLVDGRALGTRSRSRS